MPDDGFGPAPKRPRKTCGAAVRRGARRSSPPGADAKFRNVNSKSRGFELKSGDFELKSRDLRAEFGTSRPTSRDAGAELADLGPKSPDATPQPGVFTSESPAAGPAPPARAHAAGGAGRRARYDPSPMRRLARHLFTPPSTAAGYIEQLADGVKRRWRTSWPLSPMPKLADKVGADVALHLIHRARACCDRRSLAIALLVGGVMGTGVGPCMWFLPPGRHDLRAVCLMVLVVLPFVLWSTCRRLRTRRRLRELLLECGHCPSCGHDLRAGPGRCPECGADAASATKV